MSSNTALNSEPVSASGETRDREEAVVEGHASEPAASAEGAAESGEGRQAPRAEDPAPAEAPKAPGPEGTQPPLEETLARAPALQVPPGPSLGDALSALDRRDYATAKRLFETLGRSEAAAAIDRALAALDRKDFAEAQGLFEALATLRPAAPEPSLDPPVPLAADPPPHKEPIPVALVPGLDPGDRQSPPRPARTEKRRRRLAAAAVLALFGVAGAAALAGARGDWTFAAAESDARAGLASAVDLVKGRLSAMASGREDDRDTIKGLRTELADATTRLDRIERETGARLDGLGARLDQTLTAKAQDAATPAAPAPASADVSAKVDQIATRLDQLEKRVAAAAAPDARFADVTTRLDRLERKTAEVGPASQPAGLAARPDKEKTAAPEGRADKPTPIPPKRPTAVAKAQNPEPRDLPGPSAPRGLIEDYSVEDVQGGVALIDGRYGQQQVAPGDYIPGAGRVLRIERRGGDWYVLTSNGVIASNPAPF